MTPQAGAAPELEAPLLDLERRIALKKPISGPEFWNAATRARCDGLDLALKVIRDQRLAAAAPAQTVDRPKAVLALAQLLQGTLERTADAWAAGEDDAESIDQALHLTSVLVREAGNLDIREARQ